MNHIIYSVAKDETNQYLKYVVIASIDNYSGLPQVIARFLDIEDAVKFIDAKTLDALTEEMTTPSTLE